MDIKSNYDQCDSIGYANRYDTCVGVGGARGLMLALMYGQKIAAIKLLRECTGLGLKEAKDVVEQTVGVIEGRAVRADRVDREVAIGEAPSYAYGTFVVVDEDSVALQSCQADAEQEAKDRIQSDRALLVCKVVAKARTEVKIDKV